LVVVGASCSLRLQGAKAKAFAPEGDELGVAALPGLELQEAKIQDATPHIAFELALDKARQAAVLLEALAEGRLGDGW
jgi:hypothetical protein